MKKRSFIPLRQFFRYNKKLLPEFISVKNSKKQIIPLLIGHPKGIYNGEECLLLGLGWTLDKKSEVVNAYLDDPERTKKFVTVLKRVINPSNYSLKFKPSEEKMDTIKISRLLPIDWLDSNSLFKEVINLWDAICELSSSNAKSIRL